MLMLTHNLKLTSSVPGAGIPIAPPAAPTDLVATAINSTQIDLEWVDNAGNEDGQYVERSLNGVDGWTLINSPAPNVEFFSDETVAPETTYYYRVSAQGIGGESNYSNVANATTPADEGETIGDYFFLSPPEETISIASVFYVMSDPLPVGITEASVALDFSVDGELTMLEPITVTGFSYSGPFSALTDIHLLDCGSVSVSISGSGPHVVPLFNNAVTFMELLIGFSGEVDLSAGLPASLTTLTVAEAVGIIMPAAFPVTLTSISFQSGSLTESQIDNLLTGLDGRINIVLDIVGSTITPAQQVILEDHVANDGWTVNADWL